jgi:hypothetical protein
MSDQLTSAVPTSQQPAGSTGISEGQDGKLYFHDIAGKLLGLAPNNIQQDNSAPTQSGPSHPSGAFDFGFTPETQTTDSQSESQADFTNTAQPSGFDFGFTPPAEDTLSKFTEGIKQSAPVQIVKSAIMPPESADEHIAAIAGGPGGLIAYRQAKGIVNSVKAAMTASGTKFAQAAIDIKNAADQFHRGDYRNAASSAISSGADVVSILDPIGVGAGAGNVRELSEGARPGGNLVTPLTRQIIDAGTAVLGTKFGAKTASDIASDETATAMHGYAPENGIIKPVNVTDSIAEKNAAKAKFLPNGHDEIPISDVQPQFKDVVRTLVDNAAEMDDLQPTTATSIRDIGKDLGDQYFDRSKAIYKQVEDATGVNMTDLRDKISTLDDKISNAVDSPELESQLTAQKDALVKRGSDAIEQANAKGIDATQAVQDWKKGNAAYDFGKQLRMTTKTRLGEDTTNINNFADRLHKLSDSNSPTQPGRLQQLLGPDHTNLLLNHVDQLAEFEQAFKGDNISATGKVALQKLLRDSTAANFHGKPTTYYSRALKHFDELGATGQVDRFGEDAQQVRNFLQRQLAWQYLKRAGFGLAGGYAAKKSGLLGPIVHAFTE